MNSTFLKSAPLLLAAGLALGGASAAHAQVTINYSLGDFIFTAPTNDAKFELNSSPATETLTLIQGVAQTVNVQSIAFYVNETSTQNDFTGTVSRTLSINGITHTAAQGFDLTTDYGDGTTTANATDTLILYPGTSSQVLTFDLGSQGILKFTPEPLDPGSFLGDGYDTGTYISNDRGKFLLTAPAAVPEASSLVSTGVLLTLGLGAFVLRSRKRSSAQAG